MSDDETQGRPDGFRPRKKRPKGWLERAIKDGSVRDPNLPPEPEQVYPEDATVVQAPTATITDKEG
jgi:hypothetical protein